MKVQLILFLLAVQVMSSYIDDTACTRKVGDTQVMIKKNGEKYVMKKGEKSYTKTNEVLSQDQIAEFCKYSKTRSFWEKYWIIIVIVVVLLLVGICWMCCQNQDNDGQGYSEHSGDSQDSRDDRRHRRNDHHVEQQQHQYY